MINDSGEILKSIKEENSKVLFFIYQFYFPKVESFILKGYGSTFDAQDVFQDTLVVIYNKSKESEYAIRDSFGAYLFSISKYIWYKELKRRKQEDLYLESLKSGEYFASDIEIEYIRMEKRKLITEYFACLKPEYQNLLKLFYEKTPISEITRIMNYSSDQYTKNRRNHCKGLLVKEIRKNPRFNELRYESFRENSVIPRW